jgi:hypothetical protein
MHLHCSRSPELSEVGQDLLVAFVLELSGKRELSEVSVEIDAPDMR